MPPRKQIMLTLGLLATPESFRSVADLFGVGKSHAHLALQRIVLILRNFLPDYVTWPNLEEMNEISQVFRERSNGILGVIGAIDGCHIPITQTPHNVFDYYNRKGFHLLILQGTCDHNARFINVLIGAPGRAHDANVFHNSPLRRLLTDEQGLPPNYHIIGDSAYPLMQNLMRPYLNNGHLTPVQINYNTKLSTIRSVIARAISFLKNKFRRLKALDVRSVEMGVDIIAAAVTLHNFLIAHGELNVEAINAIDVDELDLDDANVKEEYNPDDDEENAQNLDEVVDEAAMNNAVEKRNAIAARLG